MRTSVARSMFLVSNVYAPAVYQACVPLKNAVSENRDIITGRSSIKTLTQPAPCQPQDPLPSPYEDEYGTPRSQEAELFVLSPPYLVSRPRTFPTPTLEVQVISAHHLKVSVEEDGKVRWRGRKRRAGMVY